MKTFETEKNNIPEGATHYCEQSGVICFVWLKEINGKLMVWVPQIHNYWHEASVFCNHYRKTMKPIPKPEVVEWKNGDECVYQGEVYAYQCVASWDSDACILSGKSRNAESLIDAWIDELSKPESPEEKEQRERLEAAYDLYLESLIGEDEEPQCFSEFKSFKNKLRQWLRIVDKTNYRKGE